jgi:hypothetical protein
MKIRNNTALFGWGFSVFFLMGCSAFLYILIRDGSSNIQIYPPKHPEFYPSWVLPAVVSVFWIAGIALANHLFKIPCTKVDVLSDRSVAITSRFPFRKETAVYRNNEIVCAQVVEGKDGDGDPYFTVQMVTNSGKTIEIAESSDRERCDKIASGFNTAMGKTSKV